MKTLMPSAASSSSSTQANTSLASCWAREPSNTTPASRPSMIRASSSLSMQRSIHWLRNGVSLHSSHCRHPRSTASTQQSRAKLHTRATSMPTPPWTTQPFVHPWPASGLPGHIRCGPRPKTSSRPCVWSFPSLVSIFLVRFLLRHSHSHSPSLGVKLISCSPCFGRQAQEGAQRKDAPFLRQRPQAPPTRQRRCCVNVEMLCSLYNMVCFLA